jgi:putative serine protease PepD
VNRPKPILAAAAAAVVLAAAGGGAGLYAALSSSSPAGTTIVRQVTVGGGTQQTANSSTLTVGEIYRRTHKGVVQITVSSNGAGSFPGGGDQQEQAQGSGFVYDDTGNIVTNEHVVDNVESISVKFWNGATYKARVVGTDASTDLAVIKVDAPASLLEPLSLDDSSKVAVGDGVVAIGSPFGLQETVTSGIVSALHRQMTSPNDFTIDDSIQTDAAINHGNSGGPLLDLHGRVIGVNSQIESDSGGNDGVGFAVPSNTVRSIARQLISTGKAEHAYLGVTIGATPGTGVLVTTVRDGTTAANAGLRAGDRITALDGTTVESAEELRGLIAAKQPGDSIAITYLRDGSKHTAEAKLGARPS